GPGTSVDARERRDLPDYGQSNRLVPTQRWQLTYRLRLFREGLPSRRSKYEGYRPGRPHGNDDTATGAWWSQYPGRSRADSGGAIGRDRRGRAEGRHKIRSA